MKQKGFTLIELLVVISIIGLLASVILISLNNARVKARDTKRKADLRQMVTAFNLYYNDNNFLPGNGNGYCASFNGPSDSYALDGNNMPAPLIVPTYISRIPSDPSRPTAQRSGNYIFLINDNTGGKFTLGALMEQDPGNGSLCVCGGATYNYCVSQ